MDFNGLLNGFAQMNPSMLSTLSSCCSGENNNSIFILLIIFILLCGCGSGSRAGTAPCGNQYCCCKERDHKHHHDSCCDPCCNCCPNCYGNYGGNFLNCGCGNDFIFWIVLIFIIFFFRRDKKCDPCSTSNIVNVDGGVA